MKRRIATILEEERIKRGMTQEEFAQFVGINRGTLSHHLKGRNPRISLLKKYSEKLNINFLELEIKRRSNDE